MRTLWKIVLTLAIFAGLAATPPLQEKSAEGREARAQSPSVVTTMSITTIEPYIAPSTTAVPTTITTTTQVVTTTSILVDPSPTTTPPPVTNSSVWDALANCESGGDWTINSGNGFSGGLQFAHSTWRAMGGGEFTPEAWMATREQQIVVAERLVAEVGDYSPWPACSRTLGLPR